MVKMADKQYLEIESKLREGNSLKSYMNAVVMNQYTISGKTRTEHWENICSGYTPTKIAYLFQDSNNYQGQKNSEYTYVILSDDMRVLIFMFRKPLLLRTEF